MKREGLFWGTLLALAGAGGIAGAVQWIASGEAAPAPEGLHLDQLEAAPRAPRVADLPDGFVPDLPPIPTLPPGARGRVGTRDEAATEDQRTGDLAAEMRLVREARGMVSTDPGTALALLEQHRERFPQGALREEREAYAIEAMVALQRTTEVERRYTEFRTDFPDSHFTEHLAELMR